MSIESRVWIFPGTIAHRNRFFAAFSDQFREFFRPAIHWMSPDFERHMPVKKGRDLLALGLELEFPWNWQHT